MSIINLVCLCINHEVLHNVCYKLGNIDLIPNNVHFDILDLYCGLLYGY